MSQYSRGAGAEYKAVKTLKTQGCFYAHRIAGSHGEIDILAIDSLKIRMIQVKKGGPATAEDKRKLQEFEAKLSPPMRKIVSVEMWEI